jgi:uncharacterized protein YjiS (DUF1127 family)
MNDSTQEPSQARDASQHRAQRNTLRRVTASARAFARHVAHRRRMASTRRVLLQLDGHTLKDIGLSRGDLYGVAGERLEEVIAMRSRHLRSQELSACEA